MRTNLILPFNPSRTPDTPSDTTQPDNHPPVCCSCGRSEPDGAHDVVWDESAGDYQCEACYQAQIEYEEARSDAYRRGGAEAVLEEW